MRMDDYVDNKIEQFRDSIIMEIDATVKIDTESLRELGVEIGRLLRAMVIQL